MNKYMTLSKQIEEIQKEKRNFRAYERKLFSFFNKKQIRKEVMKISGKLETYQTISETVIDEGEEVTVSVRDDYNILIMELTFSELLDDRTNLILGITTGWFFRDIIDIRIFDEESVDTHKIDDHIRILRKALLG